MTQDESDFSMCESEKNKNMVSAFMFSLSDFPLSVSQDELKMEQKADDSLQSLFEQVVTNAQIESRAHGYWPAGKEVGPAW